MYCVAKVLLIQIKDGKSSAIYLNDKKGFKGKDKEIGFLWKC